MTMLSELPITRISIIMWPTNHKRWVYIALIHHQMKMAYPELSLIRPKALEHCTGLDSHSNPSCCNALSLLIYTYSLVELSCDHLRKTILKTGLQDGLQNIVAPVKQKYYWFTLKHLWQKWQGILTWAKLDSISDYPLCLNKEMVKGWINLDSWAMSNGLPR